MQEKSYVNAAYQLQNKVQDNKTHSDVFFSKQPPSMTKIYVNPNYSTRNNGIHFNPHVENKPMIYINPKLLTQHISHNYNQGQFININSHINDRIPCEKKSLIHVNPKLMSKLIPNVPEHSSIQNKCQIGDLLFENKVVSIDSFSSNEKLDTSEYLSKCNLDFSYSSETKCQSLIAYHSFESNNKLKVKVLSGDFEPSEDELNLIKTNTSQTGKTLVLPLPLNTYRTFKIHGSSTDTTKRLLVSKEKQSSSKKIKTNSATMLAYPRYSMKIFRNYEKYNTKWQNKLSKNIFMLSDVCTSKMKAS